MSKKPVLAAGGIVQNDSGRIALVYRKKQNDWTIPKGKLNKSETFEQAAVRELAEETGVVATPRFLIGHSAYKLKSGKKKGRKKVVYYFVFDFIGQYDGPLAKDVQQCRWVSIEEAFDLLTHEKDKRILEAFLYGPASKNGS